MSKGVPSVSIEVVDRARAAVEDLTRALRDVGRAATPDTCAKRRRFVSLCGDLFDMVAATVGGDPVLRAASLAVMLVESGHLGRRQIRAHIDGRLPDMPAKDRAFAAGLAMGFMTEFLPRGQD